jgi:hypothetical protein
VIQAHADAVLALLRAVPDLTVYPAEEPEPGTELVPAGATPPYVAVRLRHGRGLDPSLAMVSTRFVLRIHCHCVGANDIAARAVAQLVSGALLDVEPVIAGRRSYPVRWEDGAPEPINDERLSGRVVTLTDLYRLETLPG